MKSIKKYACILTIGLGIYSCSTHNDSEGQQTVQSETKDVKAKVVAVETDNFSAKAIFSPEFGWGYKIMNNGNLYINQPHIPSIQGNQGFDSKDKAIKTADYIIRKLENNIFPPTISPKELDSLKVL